MKKKKKIEITEGKIHTPSSKFAERIKKIKKKEEVNASKIYSPSGKFAKRAKLTEAKYIARSAT